MIEELQKLPKDKIVLLSEETKKDVYGWSNINKIVEQGDSIHLVVEQDILFEE